jgi:hypothetical protein
MTTRAAIESEVGDILSKRADRMQLVARLNAKTPRDLIQLMPYLSGTGATGEELHAIRDATAATILAKLTGDLLNSIRTLSAATTRLTILGWILTAVLGVAGIVVPVLSNR